MPEQILVVRGATVCDPATASAAAADVVVVDRTIQEVGRGVHVPPGAVEIDAGGLFLTPGLIDAHVHVTAGTADLAGQAEMSPYYVAAQTQQILGGMLRRGFTTVRDVGGADHGVAAAVADGLWPGPRVIFGGKALSPSGGHADLRSAGRTVLDNHVCCPNIGTVCDGVDAVRRGARDQLRTGAHHVKLMLSGGVASPTDRVDSLQFSADEVRAAVEEAQMANRYVTGHAYTARAVNRGLDLGVRCIEHGNLIDESSVARFLEHDAFLVPTLVTYEFLKREGAEAGLPPASQAKVADVLEAGLHALDLAARGGVKIALGTDLLGSMHRHQSEEFRIRAQVQPSADILRAATEVGAELLGLEGEVGQVREGATADLLLVDADPLEDITVLASPDQHLRMVVQGGQVVHEV
ncbi:metal-dependent hydrolase family protein [Serinicoccus kebangsaanensis]|uniref:metal-dependent hydrolase family protein n=1 Tax=Serinicoccus kebangsaanensis TaxID=2602069 RepID=UPI00124DF5D9|nr:amidohydrolase family protein [Serinicoccus kebangsaanensis]